VHPRAGCKEETMIGKANGLPQNASLRVLLVEDALLHQNLALGLLRRQGHDVVIANDGKEAVEAFDREEFDLVLMDVEMPVMDGFEATAAIRKRERRTGRYTPVIAVTSFGYPKMCLALGMDAYIAKPLRAAALTRAVSELLGI
jgi:CheY-like chemotaxis protein